MGKFIGLMVIGLVFLITLSTHAGPPIQLWREFDPKTIITVKGKVEKVDYVTHPRTSVEGVHVTLKADDDQIYDVRVGPKWFLTEKDVDIESKDLMEITGSLVEFKDQKRLIPNTIRINNGPSIELRNEQGVPGWAGHGMRKATR